jgi:hypothetical protein
MIVGEYFAIMVILIKILALFWQEHHITHKDGLSGVRR